jgi:hypothetical protein
MDTHLLSPARRADSRFYIGAALATAAIVFAGFARTFYLKSFYTDVPLSNLLFGHGVVMTAWLALFAAQATLVAVGRTDLHRRLGAVGLVMALLVVGVCLAAAIDAGRRGASPAPGITPLMFMAIPIADSLVFTILVGAALHLRRRPDFHKRLMLLATLTMLTPGIARIPIDAFRAGGLPVFFGLTVAAVLLAAAIDTFRHRRLHPAFGWGGAFVILMVPIRIAVSGTAAWTSFARWLVG